MMVETWTTIGSGIASLMFLYTMFQQYFPNEIRHYFQAYSQKLLLIFYPYIQIKFHEFSGDGFRRSTAFVGVQTYLAEISSTTAKRLKADRPRDSDSIVLSMDDYEEIVDEYEGIKLWWTCSKSMPKQQSISFYPREDEKRYYVLTFHKRYREIVTKEYLEFVLQKGKEISVKKRQRKLYTNNKTSGSSNYAKSWTYVVFEHPATFDTLALEPKLKEEIIEDLIKFSEAKDYYKKVGKAWKRGYLLFGPPGTGKSTMVAAMANLLEYDVYDLELTSVKDNTELRKLLIETSGKSIIVIEDIDCSLDLTGQRKAKKDGEKEASDPLEKAKAESSASSNDASKVTLSGLLNFIDGLWSACGGERILVFTTNHVEKLDPALIRRGRMDMHIELSYCSFEVFKVLAKNYLDLEAHELFKDIGILLGETKMTPADVAEILMAKSFNDNAADRLKCLIGALECAKEMAQIMAEEEQEKEAEVAAEEEKVEEPLLVDAMKENGA